MSAEMNGEADKRVLPVVVAAAAAAIYLLVGVLAMAFGHPDEDAYILFIYSEILADNGRIGFYDGSPPIEGATDFLWMIALALFDAVGVPTAFAAQVLNALGIFIISYLVATHEKKTARAALLVAGLALLVPALRFVHAGIVGFSAPLYAGLILLLFVMVWKSPSQRLFLVPLLAIVVGLFRPDGTIIGVFMTLSGLVLVAAEHRHRYLIACAVAAGTGVIYFAWRFWYFGYLLPLPLYVKSSLEGTPSGLGSTMTWLSLSIGYAVCAALFLVTRAREWKRLGLAILPVAVFLAALSLSHLSQNISFRFQAPVGALLYFLATGFLATCASAGRWRVWDVTGLVLGAGVMALSLAGDLLAWKGRVIGQFYYTYIDTFPMYLAPVLHPDTRIVLTEAGRFPYWTPGQTFDLVGLNTPEAARTGASAAMIDGWAPDLIFVHSDYLVDLPCADAPFCRIAPRTLQDSIAAAALPPAEEEANRAIRAALAYFEYMAENATDYDTYAVSFVRGYPHVYSIAKTSGINPALFEDALAASFANPRRWSYMEGLNVVDRALRH